MTDKTLTIDPSNKELSYLQKFFADELTEESFKAMDMEEKMAVIMSISKDYAVYNAITSMAELMLQSCVTSDTALGVMYMKETKALENSEDFKDETMERARIVINKGIQE